MASATAMHLTPSDSTTLQRLFDPEVSPSANSAPPIDPSLPADTHYPPAVTDTLAATERQAIAAAEEDRAGADAILTKLIAQYPLYASAYNNRAQLRRLLRHPPADILADLDQAIVLAAPPDPVTAVSHEAATVLGMAYTQRGAVLLQRARAPDGTSDDEERAAREFELGGRWGNELGRKLARELNPYAKLCGAMVKEAMKAEYGGG